MIDRGLMNKVVLLIDSNNKHSIGAATAKAFTAEGAKVFIAYPCITLEIMTETGGRNTPEDAPGSTERARATDAAVQAIRQEGRQVEAWEVDLVEPATIPQLFDRVEEILGPVDVLVNNAAHCVPDTFIPQSQLELTVHTPIGSRAYTITEEYHDQNFALNSRRVALIIAEYTRRHIERGSRWGRIINVIADKVSYSSSEISYTASRRALESYNCSAARQLGKYGITVNVMSVGPVQTGWMTPEIEEEQRRRIPLQRVGQPEDVANVIVFLASNQARWVTGQILYVSGGSRMPL